MPKIIAFEMVKENNKKKNKRNRERERLISIVATLGVVLCVYECGY